MRLILKVILMASALLYAWLKPNQSIQAGWNLCRYLLGVGGVQKPFKDVRDELAVLLDDPDMFRGVWRTKEGSVKSGTVLGNFGVYIDAEGYGYIWDQYDWNTDQYDPKDQPYMDFSVPTPNWIARHEVRLLELYSRLERAMGFQEYTIVQFCWDDGEPSLEVYIKDDFWEEYLGGKPFLQKDVFSPEEIRSPRS